MKVQVGWIDSLRTARRNCSKWKHWVAFLKKNCPKSPADSRWSWFVPYLARQLRKRKNVPVHRHLFSCTLTSQFSRSKAVDSLHHNDAIHGDQTVQSSPTGGTWSQIWN